jgi:hypothetical protein
VGKPHKEAGRPYRLEEVKEGKTRVFLSWRLFRSPLFVLILVDESRRNLTLIKQRTEMESHSVPSIPFPSKQFVKEFTDSRCAY